MRPRPDAAPRRGPRQDGGDRRGGRRRLRAARLRLCAEPWQLLGARRGPLPQLHAAEGTPEDWAEAHGEEDVDGDEGDEGEEGRRRRHRHSRSAARRAASEQPQQRGDTCARRPLGGVFSDTRQRRLTRAPSEVEAMELLTALHTPQTEAARRRPHSSWRARSGAHCRRDGRAAAAAAAQLLQPRLLPPPPPLPRKPTRSATSTGPRYAKVISKRLGMLDAGLLPGLRRDLAPIVADLPPRGCRRARARFSRALRPPPDGDRLRPIGREDPVVGQRLGPLLCGLARFRDPGAARLDPQLHLRARAAAAHPGGARGAPRGAACDRRRLDRGQ